MKIAKLLNMGTHALSNLARPAFPKQDADEVLTQCWPDAGSSCYLERPGDWMKTDAALSIILPTYNDAAHICRSVDSVLQQETEYPFELVIINDGSPDNTAQLLRQYEALPNVKVLHQENRGHSGARNAGLQVCRGQYILFHDSDDTLLPGAVQNLLKEAFTYDADVVAGGYIEEYPDGSRAPGLRYPAGQAAPGAVSGMTCGKVFKRRFFERLQFPEGYWYEDSIIAQIILPAAKNCRCIAPEVFAYLQNEAGVSAASVGRPKSLDSLYITGALLKEKEKFGLPLDSEALDHFLYMVLLTYHRTDRLDSGVMYAIFRRQQELLQTFFPDLTANSPLESALRSGNYRRYLWECEYRWIRQRFAR